MSKSARSFRWLLLISLFITQLDSGIISTNLSSMTRDLALIPQQRGWIIAIYTIGLLLATPVMGSLIDRIGYRAVFLIELGLYFIGVIGIALSQSFMMLMVGRLLQAFGSSSLLTLVVSLVFATQAQKVGNKVGSVGALVALSTIVAPIISVISLVKTHDWRAIYFILAALIAVMFLLGFFLMPKDEKTTVESFDIKGNTIFVIGLVAFNLLLSRGVRTGNMIEIGVFVVIIALALFWFMKIEAKREAQNQTVLFSKRLWQQPLYRTGLISGLVTGFVMSLFAFLPSFIEFSYQVDGRKAGSFMTLMAIGTLIGAKVAGMWTEKRGAMRATRGGMALIAISLVLMFLTLSSFGLFLASLFLFGLSIGMVMTVPLQVMVVEASPSDRNISLSLLSISKKMGMVVGTTVISLFAVMTHSIGLKPMLLVLIVCTVLSVVVLSKKER